MRKQSLILDVLAFNGHLSVAEILIFGGANINCAGLDGFTPLGIAVERGQFLLAKLLLGKRTQMWPTSTTNCPPLCSTVLNRHKPLVEFIIEHGANIDYTIFLIIRRHL